MLRLLKDAANRSREAGRRLLLVIDGLDEDSGTGSSIAALLPRRPPPEARILVASRPHPPIPDDVASDHPLRTISPRQLDVFGYARDIERRAKHELTQLLAGEQLQRDLLGLITAAGGSLTVFDLEELTGRPPYAIRGLLGGLFGRSIGSRLSTGNPYERVYLFTHETLRHVAQQQFGNSLAAYRDRLHTWADTWRHRQWPTDTPQYLLRSYPRLLVSTEDLTRLVACATDQVRHDRMRDLTGGDALAVAEISTAQQQILAQTDPDLTSLVLLAVQRGHLTTRNSNIPIELPAVWAVLGQPIRTEALAKGLPDPAKRANALTRLARVATAGGDHDRAARLLNEAEPLVAQIADPGLRAGALARLAGEMAAGGNRERAEALVAQITSMGLRAGGLARLAEAAAAGGDHDRAEALVAEISDPGLRAGTLAWLAEAAAAGGERNRAARLTALAEALSTQITRSLHAEVLARLARTAAAVGDRDRAARLIDEAERRVGEVTGAGRRAGELARLARTAAAVGDRDRAARLVDEGEQLVAQISDPSLRARVLARLAEAAAAGGDHERGGMLLAEVTSPGLRAEALARLALAAAAAGNHDRAARLVDEAERLVSQISDPSLRAEELARLAEGMAVGEDHERAEALTAQISEPGLRAGALAWLARAAAAGGDHDKAEALVAQISEPILRAEALAQLAARAAAGGDHDWAARLIDDAESLVAQVPMRANWRAGTLARLAEAVAIGGYHDRAEALIGQITDPDQREEALGRLAEAAAAGGDHHRAEALIAQITDPDGGRWRWPGPPQRSWKLAREHHRHENTPTAVRR
ncbi:MAG: hypothetical protein ACT4NP_09935 [Pseudonocardiales bacterium]